MSIDMRIGTKNANMVPFCSKESLLQVGSIIDFRKACYLLRSYHNLNKIKLMLIIPKQKNGCCAEIWWVPFLDEIGPACKMGYVRTQ